MSHYPIPLRRSKREKVLVRFVGFENLNAKFTLADGAE
jgi:hypothetical protein